MQKRQFDKNGVIGIFNEGSESTVFQYVDKSGMEVALKFLKKEFVTPIKTETIPYETFLNKERKLLLLNQSEFLYDDEKPIDLYYIDDKFIGYSMPVDKYKGLDQFYSSSKKEKLVLLKELKQKIEFLNKNNIYIGDFNTNNFGIRKNGSIKLRDIDNFSIGGLSFDRSTNLVKEYIKKCSNIKNIDNYSFNYFSIGFYTSQTPSSLERYLKEKGLPKKLDTEENKQLLEDLENINDDYEQRYLIDSQKKGLFR